MLSNSDTSNEPAPRERILASIQVLRALAAWSIVIQHYCMIFTVSNPSWWRRGFLAHGSLGVDVFFVVSGFVMALSASDPEMTPRTFVVKRIARIVPVYWVVTIVVACAIYFTTNIMRNQGYSPSLLIHSLLFIPAQNPSGLGLLPINTVGWTLHLEVMFYLVVTLSLFAKLPQRWLWIVVGMVVVQMLLAPLGIISPFYSTTLLYEFLMGIVVAHMWKAGVLRGPMWLFGGLALLAMALLIRAPLFVSPTQTIEVGVPALLLVCACLGLEPLLKHAKLLTRLGDHSYSVYLIHPLILYIGYAAYRATGIRHGVVSFACMAVIALIGAVSYRFIERPASRTLTRLLR